MSDLRLTEEEILAEAQLNWTDGDGIRFSFAKRIESALLRKVADFLQMKADIALSRGFDSHADFMRPGVLAGVHGLSQDGRGYRWS